MAKRWINSRDVEVGEHGAPLFRAFTSGLTLTFRAVR